VLGRSDAIAIKHHGVGQVTKHPKLTKNLFDIGKLKSLAFGRLAIALDPRLLVLGKALGLVVAPKGGIRTFAERIVHLHKLKHALGKLSLRAIEAIAQKLN